MRTWAALALILVGQAASASCRKLDLCGCDSEPSWAAVIRYELRDGGTQQEQLADGGTVFLAGSSVGVVESFAGAGPFDAGVGSYFDGQGPPGTRWLVGELDERREVEADGGIRCEGAVFEAATWPAALVDRSCARRLQDAGVAQPPCNDTSRCACSPAEALSAVAILGLLRIVRRRRAA
jgi:uncharacterized protein (TIGR03382 family)